MALSDFDEDILNDFLTESLELIDELDGDLVSLEEHGEDTELLNRIFRALHTIKGSASFLAITNLVNFAHAAEDALNIIRRHEVKVTESVMDVLLRSVDVLRGQFDELQAGVDPSEGPGDLIDILHGIAEGKEPGGQAEEAATGDTSASAPQSDTGEAATWSESTEVAEHQGQDTAEQVESAANADSSDEASTEVIENREPAGRDEASPAADPQIIKLDLPGSKLDLLGFMVDDYRESLEQLSEQVERLGNSGQRHEASIQIVELAEGIGRSVEFFDCEPLARMVSILEVVGEHIDEVNETALSQILPRLQVVVEMLSSQVEHLNNGQMSTFDITLLSERLVDLVLGHEQDGEARLPSGADSATVIRIDAVRGAGNADDFDAAPVADQGDHTGETNKSTNASETDPDSKSEHEIVGSSTACNEPASGDESKETADPEPAIEVPQSQRPAEPSAADVAKSAKTRQSPAGDGKPASKAAGGKGASKLEATIRVEVRRLEALQNLVGELVIQKNRVLALSRQVSGVGSVDNDLREAVQTSASDLDRVTSEIQVGVMRTRMQPLDKLFGKYPRLVRDLARSTGKKINLVIEGGDTEVDRSVLEELGDPLVHILRNSADHGVEMPADRKAAGKTEMGQITISAEHQGGHVLIRVRDDGKGLSKPRIADKAIERGLVTADEVAGMGDREVLNLIMMAGFSTAEKVSDLSGRGVGMDVVKTNIHALGGQVELDSIEGQGTTITIKIPLTIAIMNAMMVRVDEEMYAIPLTSIIEIVRPETAQMKTVRGNPVMRLRDSVLPLIDLADEFNSRTPETKTPFAVVVGVGEQRAGLLVSHLIGQQEIVIKPLDDDAKSTEAISGATVRDDGGVSLILDVAQLIEGASGHARQAA
ncbi:MAG: chemotaxis protein CheW [Planctomycetota bacterium]